MKKRAVLIAVGCLFLVTAVFAQVTNQKNTAPITPKNTTTATQIVHLGVPHIWEIPDGVWVKPWNGACEEASVTMVDAFYKHVAAGIMLTSTAKKLMAPLFPIEDKMFGSNSDTDASRTAKLINTSLGYTAVIKKNPTLEQIKQELRSGHPVISMHYGYDLKNPRHRFRRGASSYHVMVITGYNETKKIFFVNDSELPDGLDFSYKYDTILTTLHDFDYSDKKADGPPVALFTQPGK